MTVPGSGAALVANPFPTNVTLNAINWGTSVTNDSIRIVGNGLPVGLYYNAKYQKWGYDTFKTNGAFIIPTFQEYDVTIPAGTGFLYFRNGTNFTLTWK